MPPFLRAHETLAHEEQRQKAEREPRHHNLQRRERAQQHLGGDKCRAPDKHAERAEQMPLYSAIFLHDILLVSENRRLRLDPVLLSCECVIRCRIEMIDQTASEHNLLPLKCQRNERHFI